MHLEDRGRDADGHQRWRAVAYFGSDERGKPVRRSWSFRAASRREAERQARAWEAREQANRPATSTGASTMSALAEAYFRHLEETGRSPSTLDNYRQKWRDHLLPSLGRLRPEEVSAIDLNAIYSAMRRKKLSPATIRQTHNVAAGMLGRAVKWGWLQRNVARLADPPTVSPPALQLPDVETVRAIIALIPEDVTRDVVTVLAATGARRGEVLALTWGDVDWDRRTLRIDEAVIARPGGNRLIKETKTKTVRTVAVDEGVMDVLRRLRARFGEQPVDETWPIFAWGPGEPCIAPHSVSQAWWRAAQQVGTTMPLKGLRALHATLLLDAGLSVAAVAGRTGHADGGRILLSRYAARTQGADRRAADIIGSLLG